MECFFLAKKIARVGLDAALKSYLKRIGSLFFLWSIIYFPLSLRNFGGIAFIQEYIFKTPYFLWYLSASFVGGGLLAVFYQAKLLHKIAISGILYGLGTLFGSAYGCFRNAVVITAYYNMFLTTRNGLFFAFPFMMLGEVIYDYVYTRKGALNSSFLLVFGVISTVVYGLETWTLGIRCDDRFTSFSMLLSTPMLVVFIICSTLKIENAYVFRVKVETEFMRSWSGSLYLMQYGVIFCVERILSKVGITEETHANLFFVIVYLSIVLITFLTTILLPSRIRKKLF